MDKPTAEDLARSPEADLALCQAASPGPWVADHLALSDGDEGHYSMLVRGQGYRIPARCYGTGPYRRHDCTFIAAARTMCEAYIRRTTAAEAEVARLRQTCQSHEGQLVRLADVVGKDARHAADGTVVGAAIEEIERLRAEFSRAMILASETVISAAKAMEGQSELESLKLVCGQLRARVAELEAR